MSDLVRLSFSLERPLLKRLEELVRQSRATNRSEVIRDLIRARLVEQEWERGEEALGTISLLYNHHVPGLTEQLTTLQHDHPAEVLATTHVHLDRHLCAEMILVKGQAGALREIAAVLGQQKGVLHATLSRCSTGRHLA